jgi:hypothetical protein
MQNPFSRSKCFSLIRLDVALHIVPRIRYLGFTLKGRGSLDYDGGLVRLQVQTNFDTIINRQHQVTVELDGFLEVVGMWRKHGWSWGCV